MRPDFATLAITQRDDCDDQPDAHCAVRAPRQPQLRCGGIFVALALLLCGASIALAGPREQAARIHDRLAGVPADEATLTAMAATLPGNPTAAANIAMNNPNFYAVTLKNFAAPWTNRDQNAFVPLNDYVTLVMGMVRDNVPFNQILSANMLYIAPGVSPPPSASSNAHFEALENRMREPAFNQSELAADDADRDLRHARRGDGRRDDDARGGRSVLHRGHEPRDVPLHAHEPHVHGHGAGARHEHRAGPHSPGRVAQPRRRQPRVPE